MALLLDSNAFLWLLYEPEHIGPRTQKMIKEADKVLVSAVILWELAIKHSKGILPYSPVELSKGVEVIGEGLLPIKVAHLEKLHGIKLPHKDPFDTLLVAQSEAEQCVFLTSDRDILRSNYSVSDVSK